MTSHEGESVLFGQCKSLLAHIALCTAIVYYHAISIKPCGILFQEFYCGFGVGGNVDEITGFHCFFVEYAVQNIRKAGKTKYRFVCVESQDRMSCVFVCFCYRTTYESKTYYSSLHRDCVFSSRSGLLLPT